MLCVSYPLGLVVVLAFAGCAPAASETPPQAASLDVTAARDGGLDSALVDTRAPVAPDAPMETSDDLARVATDAALDTGDDLAAETAGDASQDPGGQDVAEPVDVAADPDTDAPPDGTADAADAVQEVTAIAGPCAIDGVPCDDGNPCTGGDACAAGTCAPGKKKLCGCQKDADCLPLDDNNACNGTLACDTSQFPFQCVVDPATFVVCKAAACHTAECSIIDGKCKAYVQFDGTVCGQGSGCMGNLLCKAGACTGQVPTDGKPCEDGSVCSTTSACKAGVCQGVVWVACDDKNPCTDDSCDTGKGCVSTPNQGACSDGNPCTVQDTCVAGTCKAETPLVCTKGFKCAGGTCQALPPTPVLHPITKVPIAAGYHPYTKAYQKSLIEQGLAPSHAVSWQDDAVVITWRAIASEDCRPVIGAVVDTSTWPSRVVLIQQVPKYCNDNNHVDDYHLVLPWHPNLAAVFVQTAVGAFQGSLQATDALHCKDGCSGISPPVTGLAMPVCSPETACPGQCNPGISLTCPPWDDSCKGKNELHCAAPTACQPGQTRCATGAVLTCQASGQGWSVTPCKPGISQGICVKSNGISACKVPACAPGVPYCDGEDGRACLVSGQGGAVLAKCGGATVCLGGACEPVACAAGKAVCASVDAAATCGPKGWTQEPCAKGKQCSGGQCLDVVCTPGSRTCEAGKILECNPTGTAKALVKACTPPGCDIPYFGLAQCGSF